MAGDVCGSCGSEVLSDARFCHVCGRRLGVEPIDFDIYGTGRSIGGSSDPLTTEPSRKKALLAVSALVVVFVAGLAVFNWVTSDDAPSAAPPDTTTLPSTVPPTTSVEGSSVDESPGTLLDVGDPLAWHQGPVIGELMPLGIVEHDGQVLFFASEPGQRFGPEATGLGLAAWRSGDGASWESLGRVIDPPNELASVAASPNGMVAVGRSSEGAAAIWRSVDGIGWDMEVLPEASPSTSDNVVPTMAASIGGIDVVVGVSGARDPLARFYRAWQDLTGRSADDFNFSLTARAESNFEVRGPFGLLLDSLSAEDLGLTQDDLRFALSGGASEHSAVVWSSTDGADWQISILGRIFPVGLAVTGNKFVLAGQGQADSRIWMSDDGTAWQDMSDGSIRVASIVSWGQMLLAARVQDSVDLVVSGDGVDWQSIGLAGVLPDLYSLIPGFVTAGDDGVAVAAIQVSFGPDSQQPPAEAILVKDGYTLTANQGGGLELRRGEETLLTVIGFSAGQDDFISDLGGGTVTFVDPTTSDPYITFTLDELRELEAAAGFDFSPVTQRSLILYTSDTKTWSITNVDDITSGHTSVTAIQVTSLGLITGMTSIPKVRLSATNRPTTQIYIGEYPNRQDTLRHHNLSGHYS